MQNHAHLERHPFDSQPVYAPGAEIFKHLGVVVPGTGHPGDWKMIDGYIAPKSYCAITFGMGIFMDAHHYFSMVSKNVEAYSELAVEIDDEEFLTDTELFTQVTKIVKSEYGLNALKDLSKS